MSVVLSSRSLMLREIHSPSLTHSRHPRSILISLRSSRRLSSNQFSARTQRSSYQSSYRRTFRPNSPSLFTSSSSLLSLLSPWASLRMRRCRRQFSSTPSVQATYNQVRRGCRKEQRARRRRSPDLVNRPQMKGVCLKTGITKPKKPNSGERKTARIRLSSGKVITAYIPGEGHNVQQHSVVMVRGGRAQDCPGVKYHLVRGALDLGGVANRITSRSKYGTKKQKKD